MMLADVGEAIADLAVLRHQGELFGPVPSMPPHGGSLVQAAKEP